MRTFDIDFNGDLDLFSYYGGGISYFRNDFSMGGGLLFNQITNSIQTHYGGFQTNIYDSRVNAPALSDIEKFSMDSTGKLGQIKYHLSSDI